MKVEEILRKSELKENLELIKAGPTKYISRKKVKGKYVYKYKETSEKNVAEKKMMDEIDKTGKEIDKNYEAHGVMRAFIRGEKGKSVLTEDLLTRALHYEPRDIIHVPKELITKKILQGLLHITRGYPWGRKAVKNVQKTLSDELKKVRAPVRKYKDIKRFKFSEKD